MEENATLDFDNDSLWRSLGKNGVKPVSSLDSAANLVPVKLDQSTISPRKSRIRDNGHRKRTRESVDFSPDGFSMMSDNLTSSPKKYMNVMNKVLPSPKSTAMKDKLMSLAKDSSGSSMVPKLNGDACLPPKPSISHAWDQLFQSVHSSGAKPKLGVSKQEVSAWDSLFETMNTSSSATVVYTHSDGENSEEEELKIAMPTDFEIEPLPVKVAVHKTPQSSPEKKKLPTKSQRMYGSYRSFRATIDSKGHKHEIEQDCIDSEKSVANINDLRSTTKNSQVQEEIDEMLHSLKVSPANNSFLVHTLIELALKLQQSDRNYLISDGPILKRLQDISFQVTELNIDIDLVNWLIAVINYYYFSNGILESINVPSLLQQISHKPKRLSKLSNLLKQRLYELQKNILPNDDITLNIILKLNEFPLTNQELIFKVLSDLYYESSEQLQTKILIYFERYLELLSSPSNFTIIPRVISEFMDRLNKVSCRPTDLYCAKLLVIMTTKFPDTEVIESMFCSEFAIASLEAINRIYENILSKSKHDTRESMGVLLLGYLLNFVETKRWDFEDITQIHDNIRLFRRLSNRVTIHAHMVGYNLLILSHLTRQKQITFDKQYLICNLEYFKSIIENPGIVDKIDASIKSLS
jgi:hypothetical protein